MAQANFYEITEPENRQMIDTFGMEIELTTFKSNIKEPVGEATPDESQDPEPSMRPEVQNLGIICAGNDSNNWDKIVYIKHYLNEKPQLSDSHRTIGVGSASKNLHSPDYSSPDKALKLRFVVIGEYVFDRMVKAFVNHALSATEIIGVMVFWGPKNPSSLDNAVEWKNRIQEVLPAEIQDHPPFVLITDNISSVEWIGSGKIMESVEAMDIFCKDNGFAKWFEILKSDWRLGEQNEIGRPIDWLLRQALDVKQSSV
ncbi:ras-related protein Rab-38-like [Actinia tenebrosa]|uniref:Ras-related protein Rab-38-like n=1 Tax=Actinia tenebrosa TaxID=6105 RepID=A0A6P8IV24_ACTTE|nr:ras-related protein Rab-38-like [Actinia tenebrosa]